MLVMNIMDLPERKTVRLKEYDYSQNGAYFVTVVTEGRSCRFGRVVVGAGLSRLCHVELTDEGRIVAETVSEFSEKYPSTVVETFIVMPNHIHLILGIRRKDAEKEIAEDGRDDPAPTIGQMMGWFKYWTTKRINDLRGQMVDNFEKVWQRSYHDHIVRGEEDFKAIWEYMDDNPRKWAEDKYYAD